VGEMAGGSAHLRETSGLTGAPGGEARPAGGRVVVGVRPGPTVEWS